VKCWILSLKSNRRLAPGRFEVEDGLVVGEKDFVPGELRCFDLERRAMAQELCHLILGALDERDDDD
jgi:hypothetical protein